MSLINKLVTLIPTEGCHQRARDGVIVGESPTQIKVQITGEMCARQYFKSDGYPVRKIDRGFPCYCVKIPIE